MHNILIIEDQAETIEVFKGLVKGEELRFLSPDDFGLTDLSRTEGLSIEEQLAQHLKKKITEHNVDLVLLDTDLSREQELQTHSSYKAALRELGMPVCRYQKGGTESRLAQLPQLQRTVRDGSSAIWIPKALVSGARINELVSFLVAISQGFKDIYGALTIRPELLRKSHSPTDVLAAVIGDAELSYEFLGYAAQNLVYFSKPEIDSEVNQISEAQRYATQLGYWLFNYIITFPGPILRRRSAATYVNIMPDEIERFPEFLRIIESARYNGPFGKVEPYYWKSRLTHLLEVSGGDILQNEELAGKDIRRVDPKNVGMPAYVCMISGEAISLSQAAVNPDWVPSGASEAKIKEDVLDELGPLTGI